MLRKMIAGGLGLILLLVAFGTVAPRSVVDWRSLRAVALESDDWGLAGFVPAADSWDGLDREALQPGRFPPVYWQSTLEDADMVRSLVDILAAHRGQDGIAAVFQPNYVMGSLAWDSKTENWIRYDLPNWPPQYPRPGMWEAVNHGRALGVWHPELHASLHYDPARRRADGLSTEVAKAATERGISLFPGSEEACELAPWREKSLMAAELDHSLQVFEAAFGRPVYSIIAPDYTWHAAVETMWQCRGLRVIQAKREQRNPQWLGGKAGRVQKYLDRQWARLAHPGRVYLERNCRLEPVQAPDPEMVVDRCVADARRAWQLGEPAIVETHRVNFSHTDPAVVATGLAALDSFLAQICELPKGPVFLSDSEIAQLTRRGTSWRVAGETLVVRNGSHSARLVAVPLRELSALGWPEMQPLLVRLAAGEVRTIAASELRR